jgi:hypothetical protein
MTEMGDEERERRRLQAFRYWVVPDQRYPPWVNVLGDGSDIFARSKHIVAHQMVPSMLSDEDAIYINERIK